MKQEIASVLLIAAGALVGLIAEDKATFLACARHGEAKLFFYGTVKCDIVKDTK